MNGFVLAFPASRRRRSRHVTVSVERSEHQRVALVVQYDGTGFSGWEKKQDVVTIQGLLETAVSDVLGLPVEVAGASRTDAGTHAAGQISHFNVPLTINARRNWRTILNARLPDAVRVTNSALVDNDFHSRHSAQSRRYRYTIYTDERPNPFLGRFSWHYYQKPLDDNKMNRAASFLIAEDVDLTAFRKVDCTSSGPLVSVLNASVRRKREHLVEVEVQANRFLYGMMRLLVASLVDVGRGSMTENEFQEIVSNANRSAVTNSAPAKGLCLLEVSYQEPYHTLLADPRGNLTIGLSDVSDIS